MQYYKNCKYQEEALIVQEQYGSPFQKVQKLGRPPQIELHTAVQRATLVVASSLLKYILK